MTKFKAVRKKRCKVCDLLFTPSKTTQIVCGWKCAMTYASNKKIDNDKVIKELFDKDARNKKKKSLMVNTKNSVHYFIRTRDKGLPCVSCGCEWRSDFQAGHFHKSELFTSLKFNYDNIHGQCPSCNMHKEGNLDNYKINLPNRIGQERFNALNELALISKQNTKSWSFEELEAILKQAKIDIKNIK